MEASAIASYNVGLSTREMVVSRKPANEAVPNLKPGSGATVPPTARLFILPTRFDTLGSEQTFTGTRP